MSVRDRIHVFYLFIYFLLYLFLSLEMHQLFLYIIMTVPFIDRNKAHLINFSWENRDRIRSNL